MSKLQKCAPAAAFLIGLVCWFIFGYEDADAQLSMSTTRAHADQSQTPMGRDFYIAFPQNGADLPGKFIKVFISSATNTSVHISGTAGASSSMNVGAGKVAIYDVPLTWEMKSSTAVEDKVVHIWSDDADLIVTFIEHTSRSGEGSQVIPTYAWGNDYVVASFAPPYDTTGGIVHDYPSEFVVLADQDSTWITVTPRQDIRANGRPSTVFYPKGVPFQELLMRGHAVQYQAVLPTGWDESDLTGTLIHSTKPVGVIGASQKPQIPSGFDSADFICEMLPSVTHWGTRYYTTPFLARPGGDTFLVIGSADNQQIYTTDPVQGRKLYASLGGKYETNFRNDVDQATGWSSDRPFLLMQYSNSASWSSGAGKIGNPTMMSVPPVEAYQNNLIFETPSGISTPYSDYANIVVKKGCENTTTLDGVSIKSGGSTIIPIDTEYQIFRKSNLMNGFHKISGSCGVGVMLYGYGDGESYAYTAGNTGYPLHASDTIAPYAILTTSNCTSGLLQIVDSGTTSSLLSQILVDSVFNLRFQLDSSSVPGTVAKRTLQFQASATDTSGRLVLRALDMAGNSIKVVVNYVPNHLLVEPTFLSFLGVSQDTTIFFYDTIRNSGQNPVNITLHLEQTDTLFKIDSFVVPSITLLSGAQRAIRISFHGDVTKASSATLLATSQCDTLRAAFAIDKLVSDFSASSLFFPNTRVLDSTTSAAQVRSQGNVVVILDSVWTNSPQFVLAQNVPANQLPVTLPVYSSHSFLFQFIPTMSGPDTATAYFRCTTGLVRTAALLGNGTLAKVNFTNPNAISLTATASPNPLHRPKTSQLTITMIGTPGAQYAASLSTVVGVEVGKSKGQLDPKGTANAVFNVQPLANGSYVYRVESASEVRSGRIVIQ